MIQFILDEAISQNSDHLISKNGSSWGDSKVWSWKGFKCHWRLLGEKNRRPLLFIHGFGASSSHWRKNAQAFVNAGFRVYSIDLIGFGDSDQPGTNQIRKLDNRFWSNQIEDFLEQVVKTKKFGKAVIIGNSLGSLVALTTSVSRPELIAALIAAPLPDPAFMLRSRSSSPEWLQ